VTTLRATDAFLVGAVKLLTSALVLATGFRAVSDDDYARIVIAQRFAEAPSLDPSGTSWLPAPFWAYGAVFAAFGNGLEVARSTALAFGVLSSLLVLVAARWLGASPAGALLAALVASLLDWSAWLGTAALPEAPAAALCVLGVAALASPDERRRLLGAAAVALACFCRYEAWPIAVCFCLFSAVDARRLRSWWLAVPAFVAVLPIALWLAHGAVRHDDALFFWKRVASYKQALGGTGATSSPALEPVLALGRHAALLAVGAFALAFRAKIRGESLRPYARGFVCSGAVVAFLVVGSIGGAAPTHHAARALLFVFFFVLCVIGHAASPVLESHRWYNAVIAAFVAIYPWDLHRPPNDFAKRELELHIGDQARRLGAPALLVDTADYGHLAVTAAFQRPNASTPFDDRDPRKKRPPDAFSSFESLRTRLAAEPRAWLVVADAHAPLAARAGTVRARNARFTLVEPR
jgi:hypothetical protein